MLVNAADMLKKAEAGKYASVPSTPTTSSGPWLFSSRRGRPSPADPSVTAGAAKWMGGFVCADMVKAAVEGPRALPSPSPSSPRSRFLRGLKLQRIEAGFTSIMYDGSHEGDLPALTSTAPRSLVELAHPRGMSIEAEVGGIGGTEDGVTSNGELADPAECKQIADLGSTSSPAVSATSTACIPPTGLAFLRASGRDQGSDRRPALVLHGGTGIPEDQIKKAISPVSPRSTSIPTCSSSSPRAFASTSRLARISRARASTPRSPQAWSRQHRCPHQGAHGGVWLRQQGVSARFTFLSRPFTPVPLRSLFGFARKSLNGISSGERGLLC